MSKIVMFAEKPDVGTRLAAIIGGCYIDGKELNIDMLSDKKHEGRVKRQRYQNGFLKCSLYKKECIITWGFGHMAELKHAKDYDLKYKRWSEDLFPFIPEQYDIKPRYGMSKQLGIIKKLFNDKDVEYIINATDADREGELIFDYVYRLSDSKKAYKRLWLNAYTEEAVREGLMNLKTEDEVKYLQDAGNCRAIADWVVGSNLTVLSTLKFGGYKNVVSIGRVQTPTLALLVNRELEITDFKPQDYFELEGTFKTLEGEFYKGKWAKGKKDRFYKKEDAENILNKVKGRDGLVRKYEETRSEEKPPLLYNLTSLQMDANSKYGFSAKKTLDIAQKLYENQYLTYPRTDSRYLTEDIKGGSKRIIKAIPSKYSYFTSKLLKKSLFYSNRIFNDRRVGSHHAIIPTHKTPKDLSENEQRIYDMVAESFLRAFMSNAIWSNVKVETAVGGEVFYSAGKTLVEPGWRELNAIPKKKTGILPIIKKGDSSIGVKYEILSKRTRPPSRYTEKTLLSSMETSGKLVEDEELREVMKEKGIGTPATRASIIERLITVGYLQRKGKTLVPLKKGIKIIETLPIESIKSPELTGEWEYRLNLIEQGKEDKDVFLKDINEYVLETSEMLKRHKKAEIRKDTEVFGSCPQCNFDVVKNRKGYGCSDWKSGCKFQIWDNDICGKRLTKANVRQLLKKGETNLIKNFTSKRTGNKFDARLELAEDKSGNLKFKFD